MGINFNMIDFQTRKNILGNKIVIMKYNHKDIYVYKLEFG